MITSTVNLFLSVLPLTNIQLISPSLLIAHFRLSLNINNTSDTIVLMIVHDMKL